MANTIFVDLEFKRSNEDEKFKKIEAKASKAGDSVANAFSKGFSGKVLANIRGLEKSVIGLSAGFFTLSKAVNIVANSFANLRQFSRGIAEINTILPKNEKLTRESIFALKELNAQYGTSEQAQARAFYNIVSAGVKGTEKQLKTLQVSNQAAIAGLVDINDAARVLVSSVNSYAKAGLTAQEASDTLFIAVREGQTTFSELANFLGNVTAVAANSGVAFSELAGALAFVTKSGLATDVAVTGLRQVFVSVIKPSQEAATEAKRLGLEFNTASIRAKGLAGFLRDVQKATGGSEQSLSKLFGNVRALAPVLNIVNGNFEEFNRILGETSKSAGATADAAAIIKDNLDFDLQSLASEFSTLGSNIAGIFTPAVREFAQSFKTLGAAINSAFKPESTKEIDVVNSKLTETKNRINDLTSELQTLRSFPQKTLFGGLSTSGKAAIAAAEQLKVLKNERKSLLEERAAILEKNKQLNDEEVSNEKNKVEKVVEFNKELVSRLKTLGLTRLEILEQQRQADIASLTEAREAQLITEGEFYARQAVIQANFEQQEKALQDRRVLNAQATTDGISDAFKVLAKNSKITSGQIAKTVNSTLAGGFGNAFQAVGNALRDGTSGLDAFSNAVQATFGDLASSLGDFYIKDGIAKTVGGFPGGPAQIAAGSALKILGGLLGRGSGGAPSSGGGGSGASTTSLEDSGVFDPQEQDPRLANTTVNISVQGMVTAQKEELGLFIQDTLNEVNEKQGVIQVNTRTA